MANVFEEAETVEQLLDLLCGAASVCWNPTPLGVFDSNKAKFFSDEAYRKLEELVMAGVDAE